MPKIFYLEDDKCIARLTIQLLSPHFEILHLETKEQVDEQLEKPEEFDLLLLDRIIGPVDMRDSLARFRARYDSVPILILSAISTPQEKAELLNLSADDYIGKPYSPEELLARVNSLLRRSAESKPSKRRIGNAVLDFTTRSIQVEGKQEHLPAKAFLLLNTLSSDPGKIWNRSSLLEIVWGSSHHAEENLVEATLAHLRKRLSSLGCNFKIRNTRNVGYWLEN